MNLPRVYVHCAKMKLIWCHGFRRSKLNWRMGFGQPAIGKCALCCIYMKVMWCNGFVVINAPLEEGCGVNLS